MNSSKHGSARTQQFIYRIDYVRSTRTVYDSARTLEGARARIANRLAKPHNRAELARIYLHGKLLEETCYAKLNS